VAVEFHSLSKTYNMTGWRIAFVAGNAEIVAGLGQVKTNIDSGVSQAIQQAGIAALTGDQTHLDTLRGIYQERRDLLITGLKDAGLEVSLPKATFYLWITVPPGFTSESLTAHLLTQAAIVTTPGNGFGRSGEGFIRMALTVDKSLIGEVVRRIKDLRFTGA
jgi:LL-diaminopimelate aminotransferase